MNRAALREARREACDRAGVSHHLAVEEKANVARAVCGITDGAPAPAPSKGGPSFTHK